MLKRRALQGQVLAVTALQRQDAWRENSFTREIERDSILPELSGGSEMLKLPPPIWALIYLAIAVALSLAHTWRSLIDLRVIPLGITLIATGATSMFWAVSVFRSEGTELNPTSETNKRLVVRGPFRITRNPMYLGIVLVSLGIAFWVGSLPMFAVPILAFATANWVHIPFEEAKMRRQFGADFDDYTAKVRRWV